MTIELRLSESWSNKLAICRLDKRLKKGKNLNVPQNITERHCFHGNGLTGAACSLSVCVSAALGRLIAIVVLMSLERCGSRCKV